MEPRPVAATDPRCLPRVRRARFEDVPEILRVVERAVEQGCANHYHPAQRRAVLLSYARSLFLDVQRFETFAAELDGHLVAAGQLDLADDRLRALFVDGAVQARGVGRALLSHLEAHAAARGRVLLRGAMALNAVPFYARAGFSRCAGRDLLMVEGVAVSVLPMQKRLPR
jgi:putative acetyltransferase